MTFKQLFDDDAVANSLESLAGTLKAAKKKKFVDYGPELLLQVSRFKRGRTGKLYEDNQSIFQGASDDVVITLKQNP